MNYLAIINKNKMTELIRKKRGVTTKHNESDDESETETLDMGVHTGKKNKIMPKANIESSLNKIKEIKSIKQKDELIDIKEDMFSITKNKTLLNEIKELKNSIIELKRDNKQLKADKERLQRNMDKIQNNCNKLLNQLDLLKNQVNELEEFHFPSKLRKLLKNLIGFIIHNFYPRYMIYQETIERIYFVKAPKFPYDLSWAKDEEIINALNRILELLFTKAKEKDFVIHFVDKKALRNNYYKRIYNVFPKSEDFFNFFGISDVDRKILRELIPENYFIQIDNVSFDVNLKDLLNKISNEKNIFKKKKK